MTTLSRYVKHTPHAVDESLTTLSAINRRIVAIDMDPELMELYTRNASPIVQLGVRKEIMHRVMNDAQKKSLRTSQWAEGKKVTFASSLLTTSSSPSRPSLVGETSLGEKKEEEDYFPFQIAARLRTVLLCENWCKSINGIVQFCNVTRLSLRNNAIERIRDCEPLGLLPKLQCLALSGNPVARLPNFLFHILRICSWPQPLSFRACRLKKLDAVCVAEVDVKLAIGALHQESVYFPLMVERLHLYDIAVSGRNRFQMEEEWLRTVKEGMEKGNCHSSTTSSSSSPSTITRRRFSDVFMYALQQHCIRPIDCHRVTIDATKGKDYQEFMDDRVRLYILHHFSCSAMVVPSCATTWTERKEEALYGKTHEMSITDRTPHAHRLSPSTAPTVQKCAVYHEVLASIEAEVLQVVYGDAADSSFPTTTEEDQEGNPITSRLWHTWRGVMELEKQQKEAEEEEVRIQEATARKNPLRLSSRKDVTREEPSIMSDASSGPNSSSSSSRNSKNTTNNETRHSFWSSTSFSTTSCSPPSSFSHTNDISGEGRRRHTRTHRPTKQFLSAAVPLPSSTSFFPNPFAPPAGHSDPTPVSSPSFSAPPAGAAPPTRILTHGASAPPRAAVATSEQQASTTQHDTSSSSWTSALPARECSAVSSSSSSMAGSRRLIHSPFHPRRHPTATEATTVSSPVASSSPSMSTQTHEKAVEHEEGTTWRSCSGIGVVSGDLSLSEPLPLTPSSPSQASAMATSTADAREHTSHTAAVSPWKDVSEPTSLLSFEQVSLSTISLDASLKEEEEEVHAAVAPPMPPFLLSPTTPENRIVQHRTDDVWGRRIRVESAGVGGEASAPPPPPPPHTRGHVDSSGKGREYQRVQSVLHSLSAYCPRVLFPSSVSPPASPVGVGVETGLEKGREVRRGGDAWEGREAEMARATTGRRMAAVPLALSPLPWRTMGQAESETAEEKARQQWRRNQLRWSVRRWREQCVPRGKPMVSSPSSVWDDENHLVRSFPHVTSPSLSSSSSSSSSATCGAPTIDVASRHANEEEVEEVGPSCSPRLRFPSPPSSSSFFFASGEKEEEEQKGGLSDAPTKEGHTAAPPFRSCSIPLSRAAVYFLRWRQWATMAAHPSRVSLLRRVWHRWCGERGRKKALPAKTSSSSLFSSSLTLSPPPRRPTACVMHPSLASPFSASPPGMVSHSPYSLASSVPEKHVTPSSTDVHPSEPREKEVRPAVTRWTTDHPYESMPCGGEALFKGNPSEKPSDTEVCSEKKSNKTDGIRGIPPTTTSSSTTTTSGSPIRLGSAWSERGDLSDDTFGVLSRVMGRLQQCQPRASLPASPPRNETDLRVEPIIPLHTERPAPPSFSSSSLSFVFGGGASPSSPRFPIHTSSPIVPAATARHVRTPPSMRSFAPFSYPFDATPVTRLTPSSSQSSAPLLAHEHPYQLPSLSSFCDMATYPIAFPFPVSRGAPLHKGGVPQVYEAGRSPSPSRVGLFFSGFRCSSSSSSSSGSLCAVQPARAPLVSGLLFSSSVDREGETHATTTPVPNRTAEVSMPKTIQKNIPIHTQETDTYADGRLAAMVEARKAVGVQKALLEDEKGMLERPSISSWWGSSLARRDDQKVAPYDACSIGEEGRALENTREEEGERGSHEKRRTRTGGTGDPTSAPVGSVRDDTVATKGREERGEKELQESAVGVSRQVPLSVHDVSTEVGTSLSFFSPSSLDSSYVSLLSSSCGASSISSSPLLVTKPLRTADGQKRCPTTPDPPPGGGVEDGIDHTKKESSGSARQKEEEELSSRFLPTSPVTATPLARPVDTSLLQKKKKKKKSGPDEKGEVYASTAVPSVPSWDTRDDDMCGAAFSHSFSFFTPSSDGNPFRSTKRDVHHPLTSSILSGTFQVSEKNSGSRSRTNEQKVKRVAFSRKLMEELRTRLAEKEKRESALPVCV